MAVARAHSSASLYAAVAARLVALRVRRVLDVGCGDGPLRAELSAWPPVVGLDAAAPMVQAHPAPAVRADVRRLPFAGASFDAVTALNVLYHLADPRTALREARRVLRSGGTLLASAIARDDPPEMTPFWRRPGTSFDAEEAPSLVRRSSAAWRCTGGTPRWSRCPTRRRCATTCSAGRRRRSPPRGRPRSSGLRCG
jgi:SAM-dependent methyltransferase